MGNAHVPPPQILPVGAVVNRNAGGYWRRVCCLIYRGAEKSVPTWDGVQLSANLVQYSLG